MEIIIDSKINNPLINRTEVHFTVIHEGEGTPNREIIRSELAEKLNAKKENIVVNNIQTSFGVQKSTGYAKVYSSLAKAKDWDREHILQRNKLIEAKKDEKKPEEKPSKPEEAPKTEKPQEPVAVEQEKPAEEKQDETKEPVKEEKPEAESKGEPRIGDKPKETVEQEEPKEETVKEETKKSEEEKKE